MKKSIALSLTALFVLSAPALAHEEFRSVGLVTKRYTNADKQEMIEIKTPDGTLSLWISTNTVVKKDDKAQPVSALKTGVTVVVNSYGDSVDYSEILEARIVPAIAGSK